ncbi:MAG: hypothetical protein HYY86_03390 [Candidatus Harrisonbacteria bacterium]|nr:hypothetical protein [Candidatus Harrisonbacteria bacterium]
MKKIIILYHANCSDGFGGAWAAWKKFGNQAEYIPVYHQVPPPEGLKNKKLYLIDFTYPPKPLKKIIKNNKRVTAIDHHVTREKEVKLTENYSYAVKNSGSVLAWKYFHPDKPIPKILKFVEDMDLWRFKVAHTKEIFAYLNLFDFDFRLWNKLAAEIENPAKRKAAIEKGKIVLRYEDKLVNKLVENNAELVEFESYKTYAVNAAFLDSQIGNRISEKILPPIGIIWKRTKGQISVSLRSDGTVDVAKLAEKYGGGGHKAASGFKIPADHKLPWRYLNEK